MLVDLSGIKKYQICSIVMDSIFIANIIITYLDHIQDIYKILRLFLISSRIYSCTFVVDVVYNVYIFRLKYPTRA